MATHGQPFNASDQPLADEGSRRDRLLQLLPPPRQRSTCSNASSNTLAPLRTESDDLNRGRVRLLIRGLMVGGSAGPGWLMSEFPSLVCTSPSSVLQGYCKVACPVFMASRTARAGSRAMCRRALAMLVCPARRRMLMARFLRLAM